MSDCKVFFTKVPPGVSMDDLRSFFEGVGTVVDIFSGKDNKFGFVTFSNAKEAQRAIAHFNNKAPYYLKVDFPKKTEKSYSNSGNNRDDKSDDSSFQNGHSNFNNNSDNQHTFGGSMNSHLTSSGENESTQDFKITEVLNYLVKVKEPNFVQHLNMVAREYVQKNISSINPVMDSYNIMESNAAKLFKLDRTANGDTNNCDFKFAELKCNEPKSLHKNPRGTRKPLTSGTCGDFSENSSFSNGDTDSDNKNKWSQSLAAITRAAGVNERQYRPKPLLNNSEKPKPKPHGEFKSADEPKPFRDAPIDNENWDDEPETRNESPKVLKGQQSFENEVKEQKQVESFVIESKPVTPLKKQVRFFKSIDNRQLPANQFSKVIATLVESEGTGYVVLADKLPGIMQMQAEFQKLPVTFNFVPELHKICVGFINGERVRVQIIELGQEIVAKCIDSGATISANSDNFIDIEDEKIVTRPAEAIRIETDNSFTLQEDLGFEVKPLFVKKSKTVLVLARGENDTNNFDEVISTVKIPEFHLPKLPVICEPIKVVPAVPVIDSSLPEILMPTVRVSGSKFKSFVSKNTLANSGFIELYYAYNENHVVGSCVVDEYAAWLEEIEDAAEKSVDSNYSPNVADYCFGWRSTVNEWSRGMVVEKHGKNDYVVAFVDYGLKEKTSRVRPMTESLFRIPNFAVLLETSDPDKFVKTMFLFNIVKKDHDKLHAVFKDESGTELNDVMVLKPFFADLYF